MTPVDDAVISPIAMHSGHVAETVVLVANQGDMLSLCGLMGLSQKDGVGFFMSRLYAGTTGTDLRRVSLVGPILGAAYAALLAETLIASGAKKLLFWGWTGSISSNLLTGDVLVPDSAIADEGVTKNYLCSGDADTGGDPVALPAETMTRSVLSELKAKGLRFSSGRVWTTDALFRETPQKIRYFQEKGALAVEMETSALFSVARFRGASAAALLTVSDELFTYVWKPGFHTPQFIETRKQLPETILRLCTLL